MLGNSKAGSKIPALKLHLSLNFKDRFHRAHARGMLFGLGPRFAFRLLNFLFGYSVLLSPGASVVVWLSLGSHCRCKRVPVPLAVRPQSMHCSAKQCGGRGTGWWWWWGAFEMRFSQQSPNNDLGRSPEREVCWLLDSSSCAAGHSHSSPLLLSTRCAPPRTMRLRTMIFDVAP